MGDIESLLVHVLGVARCVCTTFGCESAKWAESWSESVIVGKMGDEALCRLWCFVCFRDGIRGRARVLVCVVCFSVENTPGLAGLGGQESLVALGEDAVFDRRLS